MTRPANQSVALGRTRASRLPSSTGSRDKFNKRARHDRLIAPEAQNHGLDNLADDLDTLRIFASARHYSRADFTPDVIRALLRYDPETGDFCWKPRPMEMFSHWHGDTSKRHRRWTNEYAGKAVALRCDRHGYQVFDVNSVRILAHRAAIAITDGITPMFVDHIDRCKSNNRRSNLRVCSRSDNNRNIPRKYASVDNHPGVRLAPDGVWLVNAKACGRAINLGRYLDFEVAIAVRNASLRWIEELNARDIECSLGADPRIGGRPLSSEMENLRDGIPNGHALFAKILNKFPFIHADRNSQGARHDLA